ncbi:Protein T20F5.6 [Aphelenchoides avenae]|nr:Protein T20F5.6 [Aphelenchus avenae]
MDVSAQAQPKECPICQDTFNTTRTVPKIFGVCGHSVCAVCVSLCVQQNRATCPLCRQETPVPANGLPINFGMRDVLESVLAVAVTGKVKCSGCAKNVPSAEVFACKACTTDKMLSFCALCVVKGHRAHEVVELEKLATPKEVSEARRLMTFHTEQVGKHVENVNLELELAKTAVERIVNACQLSEDVRRVGGATFLTKEENQRLVDESRERTLNVQKTCVLIRQFNQALKKIPVDETVHSQGSTLEAASSNEGLEGGACQKAKRRKFT